MKRLVVLIPLVWVGYSAPLRADDNAEARAIFARICVDEAMKLGHRGNALAKYAEACVKAKLKVFDDDMSDPATANLPKSC
jgi:hypothetical protein